MAVCTSTGVGLYAAGEGHVGVVPRIFTPQAKRGVLVAHGHGANHITPVFGPYGLAPGIPAKLAEAGMPVLSCEFGGVAPWSNDTALARVTDGWSYIKSAFGAKTDKVLLYGSSMGSLTMLNWAKANPTLVAAIALHLPLCDLADIHDNNRGSYAAEIETAFGGLTAFNTAKNAHNPAVNTGSFSSIPIKMWYANNDTIVPASTVTAFATATGAQTADLGAVGHTTNTLDPMEVVNFLLPYS